MVKSKKYVVTVAAQFGNYDVVCKNKKDLNEYLKVLKKQHPYFKLVKVKPYIRRDITYKRRKKRKVK